MEVTELKRFFTRNPYAAPITRTGLAAAYALMRRNPLQRFTSRVRTLEYLNVGCGKKMCAHTINLNYEWYPGIDLTFDITRPLPIKTGRLRGVYSEHVLEHLPVSVIAFVLSEWKRVLRPGTGIVRILVPDAELYVTMYARIQAGEQLRFPAHDPTLTPMMHVNRAFRAHEHLYAYDFETLGRMLEAAGFTDIRKCRHRQGRDPNLLLDSEERDEESLRVEASVPAS